MLRGLFEGAQYNSEAWAKCVDYSRERTKQGRGVIKEIRNVLFMIYDIYVYVIAWEGVKFGINFTSCSDNDNDDARGAAKCYFANITTTSGIYPKISLLPVLSKYNSIAYFDEVKICDFQARFHNE